MPRVKYRCSTQLVGLLSRGKITHSCVPLRVKNLKPFIKSQYRPTSIIRKPKQPRWLLLRVLLTQNRRWPLLGKIPVCVMLQAMLPKLLQTLYALVLVSCKSWKAYLRGKRMTIWSLRNNSGRLWRRTHQMPLEI